LGNTGSKILAAISHATTIRVVPEQCYATTTALVIDLL
jgi:hypothetical protein